ncbi:MAG: succinylglutamate desuccinylase/aspartoacylase family protein [Anaerolineae bacterium]
MVAQLEIGTAKGQPGRLAYGAVDAVPLPTGDFDRFPIVIAQGREPGPTLWLTASIHGNEYTGLAVLHRLLDDDLARRLRGAVVAAPTLNPAGLRAGTRSAYYLGGADPNRLFPAPPLAGEAEGDATEPPSALESAYRRLFDVIRGTADYLIDLHCASIASIPFAFIDPVFYREGGDGPDGDKATTNRLYETVQGMAEAFGLSVIREFVSREYLSKKLHRSVSGALLNLAHIPAFTAELGSSFVVDRAARDAAVAGLRNVMRWAGMLDGPMEPVAGVPIIRPGYPVRRMVHPRVPCSCIVHYLVNPGDAVRQGQPVAELRDIYGRPATDDGLLRTDHDGHVLAVFNGALFFENEAIMTLAVSDEREMVLPYPDNLK